MNSEKKYDIDVLLEEVVTLPSLPHTLANITELINKPDCSLVEVAKIIAVDPSLAIKTLRLVNSAYYGVGQEVTTIEHAVVLLGLKVIRNLALTATVFDTLKSGADRFLRHSIACGVAMRVLAENGPLASHVGSADEAFVYGLLHDVGKVILAEGLAEAYARTPGIMREQRLAWYQAEREAIGVDHAQVGSALARNWKLSPMIGHGIAGHHDLRHRDPDMRKIAATLCIADYLCSAAGIASHDDPVFQIPDETWSFAAIDKESLPAVIKTFFQSFPLIEELVRVAA